MLERCFVRPETLSQIHSSWMGQAIEQYDAWLCDRGYREGTLATRVSLLMRFGTFAQTHGAQRYEELPAHVGPSWRSGSSAVTCVGPRPRRGHP